MNSTFPRPVTEGTCSDCQACCCRQEAMLFGDLEIPAQFIATNQRGGDSMARLADGWCAALDRNSMKCSIYAKRPWICREFELGGDECLEARTANGEQAR
jgi:uncharacterized protein